MLMVSVGSYGFLPVTFWVHIVWQHADDPLDFVLFVFPDPTDISLSPRPLKRRCTIQDDVMVSPPAVMELLNYRSPSLVSCVLFGDSTWASLEWLYNSSLLAPVPRSPVQLPTATHKFTLDP